MACPHVAGAAALILQKAPDSTPSQVADTLRLVATPDVVEGEKKDSPNLLLYTGDDEFTPTTTTPKPKKERKEKKREKRKADKKERKEKKKEDKQERKENKKEKTE